MFIDGAGAYRWIDIVAHKLVAQIEHHRLLGACGVGFGHHGVQVFSLAYISNHGDYIHTVVLVEPGDNDRGVETT